MQSKFGGKDVIVMGIYRSPKAIGKNYYEALEKELHEICSWISLQRQFFIIMGDLNLNKLRPGDKEGKSLGDLGSVWSGMSDQRTYEDHREQFYSARCYSNKPTRFFSRRRCVQPRS